MSKITGNYKQLIILRNEINEYSKKSISFVFFNREKIKNFFARNQMHLQLADEKTERLTRRYVKQDEKGNAIRLEDKGDGFVKFDFNNAEDEKAFNIEYNDFMKRNVIIEC